MLHATGVHEYINFRFSGHHNLDKCFMVNPGGVWSLLLIMYPYARKLWSSLIKWGPGNISHICQYLYWRSCGFVLVLSMLQDIWTSVSKRQLMDKRNRLMNCDNACLWWAWAIGKSLAHVYPFWIPSVLFHIS